MAPAAITTVTNTGTIQGTTTGQLDATKNAINKIEWDTSGGGNLHYILTPNADKEGEYLIQLTAMHFQTRQEQIVIPADEVRLHNRIDALFGGRLKITEQTMDPNARTGSFSQVTLYNALGVLAIYKRPVIANRGAENLFDEIRAYIEANIDNPQPTTRQTINEDCSKLATLEGTWSTTQQDGTKSTRTLSTIKKIPTTDGTEQFEGTDEVTEQGCFGQHNTTRDMHYVLDRASCILTQQSSQLSQAFKILSVGRYGKHHSAFKMVLCNDSSCAQVGKQEITVIREKY